MVKAPTSGPQSTQTGEIAVLGTPFALAGRFGVARLRQSDPVRSAGSDRWIGERSSSRWGGQPPNGDAEARQAPRRFAKNV